MSDEQEEIQNLDTLVGLVAKKIEAEIKAGNTERLTTLLWEVPTNILAEHAKDD